MRTKKETRNCLVSELRNMVSELELGTLNEELLYNYFRIFMCDAGVDTDITISVLEEFGELGKAEARNIKVSEGY